MQLQIGGQYVTKGGFGILINDFDGKHFSTLILGITTYYEIDGKVASVMGRTKIPLDSYNIVSELKSIDTFLVELKKSIIDEIKRDYILIRKPDIN